MGFRTSSRRRFVTPLPINASTATDIKTEREATQDDAGPASPGADDRAARLASEVEAARRRAAFASRPDLRDGGPPSWSARFTVFAGAFARRHAATAGALALAIAAGILAGRMLPQPQAPIVIRTGPELETLRGSLAALDAKTGALAAAADVHAIERRIVSLREAFDRNQSETAASLGQLAARDPSGSIAQLSVQIGRLEDALRDMGARLDAAERRANLAPAVTGSIASLPTAATPTQTDTGTTVQAKSPETKSTDTRTAGQTVDRPVLNGWLVHDVRRGVALVEGPAGLLEVARGQSVPGLGKVEAIERRGRGWTVLTSRGLLEPAPW